MKKLVLTVLLGLLFTMTGCNQPNIEEEREQLKDYLVDKEAFTCVTYDGDQNCKHSLPLGIGYPDKDDVVISQGINFGDPVLIEDYRLHTKDDQETYITTDYNIENDEFTADILVKIHTEVDGEADVTTVLTAQYQDKEFTVVDTTLTDEEVSEIKHLTLDNFDAIKNDWNYYFEEADVIKDDLY